MTDLEHYPDAVEAKWSSGDPTLATSGAIFLEGEDWGAWDGRLAVATLKTQSLRVFDFTDDGTLVSSAVVPELSETYGPAPHAHARPRRRPVCDHLER